MPFSLGQAHVEEGEADVWDEPERDSGLLALQVGTLVRDRFPDRFPAVHASLFALRHDEGKSLRDEAAAPQVLRGTASTPTPCSTRSPPASPSRVVKAEHTEAVERHKVWGVPTFIVGRPGGVRPAHAPPRGRRRCSARPRSSGCSTCSAWPELNEFKHTSIPR